MARTTSDPSAVAGVAADAFFGLVKFVAVLLVIGVVVAVGVGVYNTQMKPTTKSEVCESYDQLNTQAFKGNGIIGNPLFNAAKSLGGKASRYQGDAGVRSDGEKLKAIGDSSSTTIGELVFASQHIAALCGGG